MTVSRARSRTILRALAVVSALLALAQVVVGTLAVSGAEGRADITAMGVALLLAAAISAAVASLCLIGLRRSR